MFWEFDIERVANTLTDLKKMFKCSDKHAWDNYMHDLIKEQFTYEEVINQLNKNNKE